MVAMAVWLTETSGSLVPSTHRNQMDFFFPASQSGYRGSLLSVRPVVNTVSGTDPKLNCWQSIETINGQIVAVWQGMRLKMRDNIGVKDLTHTGFLSPNIFKRKFLILPRPKGQKID